MAEKGITLEYFNLTTIKNSAEKVNKTIGKITPPNGKGFGVESALTNLEQVDTTITQSGTAVKVHTLDLTLPTEQSVADAILDAKVDLLDDVNTADSELQTQITSQAARITELNNIKLNKNQGSINSGKILVVDSNGNVVPTSGAEMGGLIAVAHDQSLEGAGTDADPLRVSDSLLEDMETTQNNLSDLGNQVQGIEEKIPENASPQNQMATKSDITNKITNCITEIPQDIKLELVDGAVVLKAGSKGYRPNGAGVFNQITASTDISRTTSTDGVYMVVSWGLSSLELVNINSFFSGATQPVNPPKNSVWYDTTNNVIKETYDSGATWGGTLLLPLGIVTVSNGSVSSIDQVFNGFGYIGSCVFTLPGVKGLYPNGRNEDGTLKNGLINCTDVQVSSNFNDTVEHTLMINPNGRCAWYSTTGWYYNDIANVMVASTGTVLFSATLGTFKTTNGVVSNLNPYEVFHAVDYSDTGFIAHQAMPSDRYVDLTLGVSGILYKAPADGYVCFEKMGGATNLYIQIIDISSGATAISRAADSSGNMSVVLPISKGRDYQINYNATGSTTLFRFIYANGSK